ncbi:MAG TPA: hypothetical protein VHZ77_01620 [Gaiellaceae bacterium]|nr:hypothetical protein [Gaiellaceae bacterium]
METTEPPPAETVSKTAAAPVLDTQNVLWYFGALAGTGASFAVVAQVSGAARGLWILLASLAFIAAYALAATLLIRSGWLIPGGVIAATAVTFVPLAVAAFEVLVGLASGNPAPTSESIVAVEEQQPPVAHGFDWHGFSLAVATVAAGLAVYWLTRYSYVFLWVAIATLLVVELFVPAVDSSPSTETRVDVLFGTGLAFVAIGLYADWRAARREAFWWHLVGLWALTLGFSYHVAVHSSPGWIFVVAAGIVALGLSIELRRASFAFFGLLGIYSPFVHYSDDWFGNLGIAFALAVLGFAILAVGISVQQSGGRLSGRLARPAV